MKGSTIGSQGEQLFEPERVVLKAELALERSVTEVPLFCFLGSLGRFGLNASSALTRFTNFCFMDPPGTMSTLFFQIVFVSTDGTESPAMCSARTASPLAEGESGETDRTQQSAALVENSYR